MDDKKLYKVTLKGMTANSTGTAYGTNYVVAQNPDEAYTKVRNYLDKENIGYSRERALDKIELIAEDSRYTDSGYMLYL